MRIDRKKFIQGAGALMGLPFLESVNAATSKRTGRPPLRMGIVTVKGGTVLESWVPKKKGKLDKLPSIMRTLEPIKRDITIVSGLSQEGGKGNNAHNHCANVHLTCDAGVQKVNGKFAPSISIDQLVANSLPQDHIYQSLELGTSNGEATFSFKADGTSVPYEGNMRLAFERMFKGRKPVAPNWNRRAAVVSKRVQKTAKRDSYESYVVDLVREEAKSLRRIVSGADKQRLDQYIESVHSVEKRLQLFEQRVEQEQLDAVAPGKRSSKLVMTKATEAGYAKEMVRHWQKDPELHEKYFSIFCDLMILAFQTDTTRVCTLSLGSDGAQFPGVVTVGYETHAHTLEHQGNARRVEDADPISREGCRQIHEWYTKLFGRMALKMKMIDEGGSSLLDNTMMLYTSYMSNGGHGRNDYPMMMVGNAQGTIKTGYHVQCDSKTPTANLYMEMAARMGVDCKEFGNSKTAKNARYSGKIPGLG
ncbi:MAG: DUF1552 domain-containing protein [Lentisphaeraceae bacterium]|nr:DUF1552 domain-containing protein [Lentisphaeraceae bacterium]